MDLEVRAKALKIKKLNELILGLGWSPISMDGQQFDLDVSVLAIGENGKVLGDAWFIFYNQLTSPDAAKSIRHSGDNIDGEGEGDDERVKVNLTTLPPEVKKLVFTVSIHEAEERKQTFDQVGEAYIRVLTPDPNYVPLQFGGLSEEELLEFGLTNEDTGLLVMTRFDLTKSAKGETIMIFGEVYRHKPLFGDETWKFRAIGEGYDNGLEGLAADYGVNVA